MSDSADGLSESFDDANVHSERVPVTRSAGKPGYLEDQFSADMSSLNHPMCSGCLLQGKLIDYRYADHSTINQMSDLPHRLLSALKVDNESDLAEPTPLSLLG